MVQMQKLRKISQTDITNKNIPTRNASKEVNFKVIFENRPKITPSDVQSHFKETAAVKEGKPRKESKISPFWKDRISSVWSLESTKRDSSIHKSLKVSQKNSVQFLTNSQYIGGTNSIGLTGFGKYVLPNQVVYTGKFKNSMFHGTGSLYYPVGQIINGVWSQDNLINFEHKFAEGLSYEDNWWYCHKPDRRFLLDIVEGLQPVCTEHLTADKALREIPEGCYDVGEGFYNPKNKCIVDAGDTNKVVRIPSLAEEKWIIKHCRKAWDEPTGFRPDLYECWITGRRCEGSCFTKESDLKDECVDEEKLVSSEEDIHKEAET